MLAPVQRRTPTKPVAEVPPTPLPKEAPRRAATAPRSSGFEPGTPRAPVAGVREPAALPNQTRPARPQAEPTAPDALLQYDAPDPNPSADGIRKDRYLAQQIVGFEPEKRLPVDERSNQPPPEVIAHAQVRKLEQIAGQRIVPSETKIESDRDLFVMWRAVEYNTARNDLKQEFPRATGPQRRAAFDQAYEDAFRANRGHFTRPNLDAVYERAADYLRNPAKLPKGAPRPIEAAVLPPAAEQAFFFRRR